MLFKIILIALKEKGSTNKVSIYFLWCDTDKIKKCDSTIDTKYLDFGGKRNRKINNYIYTSRKFTNRITRNIMKDLQEVLKNADIRLIGIDLDGTLFNNQKKITDRTLKILERAIEKGIQIVPATGRHFNGIPEELKKIEKVQYAMTTNGAAIYDVNSKECIYEDPMVNELALELIEKLDKNDILIDAFIKGNGYTSQKNIAFIKELNIPDVMKDYMIRTRIKVPSLYEYVKEEKLDVQKFTMNFKPLSDSTFKDRDKVLEIAKEYPNLACVSGGMNNVELTNATATKGTGLVRLGEMLGITRNQIMAIGDSGNDFEMLKIAGIGVAMANSEKEVLEIADIVTKSNEEDGVAYIIEEYLNLH